MNQEMAQRYNLGAVTGALVYRLPARSAAARAGLQAGDIVVAMDGRKITDADQLNRLIIASPVGSSRKFDVVRDGRRLALDISIVSRQQSAIRGRY
jgi:serine protease Do